MAKHRRTKRREVRDHRPNRTRFLNYRICPGCGELFEFTSKRQIFHSGSCKDRYYRKQKKEMMNANTNKPPDR